MRRKDDEPEAIRNRLRVYHTQTAPVLEWFRTNGVKIVPIDAVGTPDAVTTRAMASLGK